MRTWAKGSAPAALLAVGVMAFTGGTAFADTSGSGSVGGGNQVNLPISLPIDISGNAAGVAGDSTAASQGGASVENTGGGIPGHTSGDNSVLGGNQVNAPISAPVNACGNAVSLFGSSEAGCKGGSQVKNAGRQGAGGNTTNGDHSLLGGNQITAPISAPVNACGNAFAIFGDATAGCKGGAIVQNTGVGPGGNRTSGRSSLLGGNQVIAPISGPINICGNSVAIFGEAFAGCKGGASVANTTGGGKPGRSGKPGHGYMDARSGSRGNDTDGRFGAGSGNQVIAPVGLPVNLCGNAVGNAPAGCKGGSEVENSLAGSGAGGNRTDGRSGVLSGNQAVAPITAPVNVCGNAVAAAGDAFAGCLGGASVHNGGEGAGGNTTSGRSGVLSGNQAIAPITAPINACGNAAAVFGESEAHCRGGAMVDGGPGGGGNVTSGEHGVAAGNQVVAPITAPVNACGNAAAVLGDAAAGCLGGAHVGHPAPDEAGYTYLTHSWGKVDASRSGGLLPALPMVPALSGAQDVGNLTRQMSASGLPSLPVVGDVTGSLGLPHLPGLPGLPGTPGTPGTSAPTGRAHGPASVAAAPAQASSPLTPVTNLAGSLPVVGSAGQLTNGLPTGGLGLVSSEESIGASGMNLGSLVALALGALCAASAVLFGTTRRFRLGRR
ncbi:DUF320 domain-containing protein [Streptosporangiaceae bacterium NEAU-GS5]|nr:DUF320 domain-containing protein [Streptosporangiaceae bacterium NEAU-GS5]